jgi:hypothetical protein
MIDLIRQIVTADVLPPHIPDFLAVMSTWQSRKRRGAFG